MNFYKPLAIADFADDLSCCWGGIDTIDAVVGGTDIDAMIKG